MIGCEGAESRWTILESDAWLAVFVRPAEAGIPEKSTQLRFLLGHITGEKTHWLYQYKLKAQH